MARRPDYRSAEAQAYRRLYGTARWKRLRAAHLQASPLCIMCHPRIVPATVCDHIGNHKGDEALFWEGPFQSLCKPHHDQTKQREDRAGFSDEVDASGWPMDAKHPANTRVVSGGRVWFPPELLWPSDIALSAIPLTIVCGPAAAGKSTYVDAHRAPTDIVIDLDQIIKAQTGISRETDRQVRHRGLMARNDQLRALAHAKPDGRRAWFITGAPRGATRKQWAERLGADNTLLMATDRATCIARVQADVHRYAARQEQIIAIERWWDTYSPWAGDRPI